MHREVDTWPHPTGGAEPDPNMHPDMSWLTVLEHHAARRPTKPLAVLGADVVTYGGMRGAVGHLGGRIP